MARKMTDNIVGQLRTAAIMQKYEEVYCPDLLRDAANEIKRLRAQVYLADGILGSEPMIWLIVGSNHPEAQRAAISPAISAYWEQYGNAFRLKD